MIIPVQAVDRDKHSILIDRMHHLRSEVFHDRLGWNVTSIDGRERDGFDDCNPLYLLSVSETGALKGSLRLLPTTGPTMLRDVFTELLHEDGPIVSPLIWESTRFCVTKEAAAERTTSRLNRTTGELLAGIVEVGMKAGLQSVISVYDSRMRRILRTAGAPAEEWGPPVRIGSVMTYAGAFEISTAMWSSIAAAAGIETSVLSDSEQPTLQISTAS